MNRRTAIGECKKLWGEIEDSGLSKDDFLLTPSGSTWRNKYEAACPLCDYVTSKGNGGVCEQFCPLYLQLGDDCADLGFEAERPCPSFWEAVKKLKIK